MIIAELDLTELPNTCAFCRYRLRTIRKVICSIIPIEGDITKRPDGCPLAEVKHGRWINVEPAPHNLFYATCSVCGDRQTIEVANYCPMCGAKMDECEVVSETGTPPEWGDRSWAFKGGTKMDEVSE